MATSTTCLRRSILSSWTIDLSSGQMQQRPDDGVGAPHATCPSLQVMATSTTEQLHVACTACRLPRSAPARGRRGPGDCWDVLRHTAHHSCLVDIAFLWQATTDSIAKWRSSDEATLVLSHQGVFRRIYDILIRSEGIREEQVDGWLGSCVWSDSMVVVSGASPEGVANERTAAAGQVHSRANRAKRCGLPRCMKHRTLQISVKAN